MEFLYTSKVSLYWLNKKIIVRIHHNGRILTIVVLVIGPFSLWSNGIESPNPSDCWSSGAFTQSCCMSLFEIVDSCRFYALVLNECATLCKHKRLTLTQLLVNFLYSCRAFVDGMHVLLCGLVTVVTR